jgi:hypothetical protein
MKENQTSKILPEVQAMIDNPGLYLCINPAILGGTIPVVPIYSHNGTLYAMKLDVRLNPLGFYPAQKFSGPLLPP